MTTVRVAVLCAELEVIAEGAGEPMIADAPGLVHAPGPGRLTGDEG